MGLDKEAGTTQRHSVLGVLFHILDLRETQKKLYKMTLIDNGDVNRIMEIAYGYAQTDCITASYDLGVYEALNKGSKTSSELAKSINVPDVHVDKLCNCLASMGLLDKENDKFLLNDASTMHLIDDPKGKGSVAIGKWLSFVKMVFDQDILQAIKQGDATEKDGNKDVFQKYEKKASPRGIFQGGMSVIAETAGFMTNAFDLSGYKTYADLGSGVGTFAVAMKKTYPNMDVTIADLPRVMEDAKKIPANIEAGIKFHPVDFLKDEMPKCDLMSFNHVLHNWNDESCVTILTSANRAIKEGGGLLVMDSIYNDSKVGPPKVNLTEMGQIAHHEGKHRTHDEFVKLLGKMGFEDVQVKRIEGFCFYDAILAKKVRNV